MLITRRKNRTSSQELSPAPTSAMLVSAEQWSSSSTLLHFAQLPALTPNAQEMFWSQPANHLKCLPRLWQIAQVALNMFKPHNKISACLRPSARLKGWEQGNVTYWQHGLGPSSLISNWAMRPCFMFLLKTARNCTRPFELPSSTVCMGSVRAPFTSLQTQTVFAGHLLSASCTGPRAALAPTWPVRTAWPQHAVQTYPLFCYCLRKGWSPSPCHSHPCIPFPDPGYWILQLLASKLPNLCIHVKSSCELLASHNSSSNTQRSPPTSTAEPEEIHNRWLWQKHIFYFVPSVHQKASVPVPLIPTIKPCMTY